MNIKFLFKILTISLFILACGQSGPRIDVSDSKVEIGIQRLEVDLFTDENDLTPETYQNLKSNYGHFFDLFVEGIIAVGRAQDSNTIYYLNHFKNDLQVQEIADVTLQTFPELSLLQIEMNDAFKRYGKLFPEKLIPRVYTYISAFSYTIVVDDSLLGIGLDMYLGSDQKYYQMLGLPAYKIRNMNPESITPDCMKSWLTTEFELNSESSELLSHMVYHGKLLYALDLLLPDVEDSIKIGYSAVQMQWVRENEKDMWFHFAENELLYNKEGKQIQKYIGEGPFTPGFPEGSPGMTGRWLGWQIVRRYMENTNALDIQALFNEKDAQKILKISKYKPI